MHGEMNGQNGPEVSGNRSVELNLLAVELQDPAVLRMDRHTGSFHLGLATGTTGRSLGQEAAGRFIIPLSHVMFQCYLLNIFIIEKCRKYH